MFTEIYIVGLTIHTIVFLWLYEKSTAVYYNFFCRKINRRTELKYPIHNITIMYKMNICTVN